LSGQMEERWQKDGRNEEGVKGWVKGRKMSEVRGEIEKWGIKAE
jgi:hypothetical protein